MFNKTSPIALYYQIAEELSKMITSGEIAVGEKLPSEADLMNSYNVSRTTIRLALEKMLHDGLIEKKRGLGTYACEAKVTQNLGCITSWAEAVAETGRKPHSEIVTASEVPASDRIAKLMEIESGRLVYYIRRLRYIDGKEACISENYILPEIAPGLLEKLDASESLYYIFEKLYGVTIYSAVETIEASMATSEECELLKIKKAKPILRITRVTRNPQNKVIEVVMSANRSDSYAYSVKLLGRPTQATD